MKTKILKAARENKIPEAKSGLWEIFKMNYPNKVDTVHRGVRKTLPPCTVTYLSKYTLSTMHLPHGEIVMEDTPFELRTHLHFMLKARGNILITGLGLGCVIRGCLANPNVKHITCIENSVDVLTLVRPFMPKKRLTIIQANAMEWTKENKFRFDYAWHDLYTDVDSGEPHLQVWHGELIKNCSKFVRNQGAWSFPRIFKRKLHHSKQVNIIG